MKVNWGENTIPSRHRIIGNNFHSCTIMAKLCRNDLRQLEENCNVKIMEWSHQSPDLNPHRKTMGSLERTSPKTMSKVRKTFMGNFTIEVKSN